MRGGNVKNESFAVYISIIRKYFVSYCTEKISNFGVTYTQLFVLIYIAKIMSVLLKKL